MKIKFTVISLLLISGFCISCHHPKIINDCDCSKGLFWSNRLITLDSIRLRHDKPRLFFVDSTTMIKEGMKPYNMSIIEDNFKRIDPFSFEIFTKPDSSIFNFILFDTLRQMGKFRQDVIMEYRGVGGFDFSPYKAYRIIVTSNDKFISSTLIAEDASIIGGHNTICSSYIFSDSIILRKTCQYYSDTTAENVELLIFNRANGSYNLKSITGRKRD